MRSWPISSLFGNKYSMSCLKSDLLFIASKDTGHKLRPEASPELNRGSCPVLPLQPSPPRPPLSPHGTAGALICIHAQVSGKSSKDSATCFLEINVCLTGYFSFISSLYSSSPRMRKHCSGKICSFLNLAGASLRYINL